jgi:hypothetical protein
VSITLWQLCEGLWDLVFNKALAAATELGTDKQNDFWDFEQEQTESTE